MKENTILISLIFIITAIYGQTSNPNYDDSLAKKSGADDFGMKSYILVILKTGNANITDKPKRDSLFTGHFENINRLATQKKLVVAGPLNKNANGYRGIFILDVNSVEEATKLLENDPTISENIFVAEYFKWYGSAALPEYLDEADKIWKKKP
jgi:uncharacterized protein YciI